jgi:hypothetical protein
MAFRQLRSVPREETVQETVASALVAYARLAAQGEEPRVLPSFCCAGTHFLIANDSIRDNNRPDASNNESANPKLADES